MLLSTFWCVGTFLGTNVLMCWGTCCGTLGTCFGAVFGVLLLFCSMWFGSVGMVWFGLLCNHGSVGLGFVWSGLVSFGVVWSGLPYHFFAEEAYLTLAGGSDCGRAD